MILAQNHATSEKEREIMLKMEYFYYMKEVCQTGSINRAAENLYISQPYLSQTLKKIEQQLGRSLLKRSNKGISLTDAGKEFLNISKEIIQLTQQAESLHNQYECFPRAKHSSMPSFTMMNLFQQFLKGVFKNLWKSVLKCQTAGSR